MTINLEQLLLIVGGTLLGVAAVLGFAPVKASGVSCGTGLTGVSRDAFVADLTSSMTGGAGGAQDACEDAVSGRRATTLALGVPALGLLVAGGIVRSNAQVREIRERG